MREGERRERRRQGKWRYGETGRARDWPKE